MEPVLALIEGRLLLAQVLSRQGFYHHILFLLSPVAATPQILSGTSRSARSAGFIVVTLDDVVLMHAKKHKKSIAADGTRILMVSVPSMIFSALCTCDHLLLSLLTLSDRSLLDHVLKCLGVSHPNSFSC
jgi:hypothetical protein